jgi:hypothetical protein
MCKAFDQVLRRDGGNVYKKNAEEYYVSFSSPWFVGRDRFDISASAWLTEREATMGSQAKENLAQARIEELVKRRDDRVDELNAAQK